MYAPLMPDICWFSFCAMAGPLRSLLRRSSNGLSDMNTMPELGLLTKPLIDKPGKATADSTPGVFMPISDI
ncbi:hypothetical protein D3C81_2046620 [compost metagenome]